MIREYQLLTDLAILVHAEGGLGFQRGKAPLISDESLQGAT